jgi:D-2-hydroxyacid dehydrogenase (NADP+)
MAGTQAPDDSLRERLMKVVVYLADRKTELANLFARFPNVSFVVARTLPEYRREISDAEILIVWSSDYSREIASATKELGGRLKWLQFATSGVDGAIKRGGFPAGVTVTNAAGLRAPNLAEHAFVLLLFLTRNMRLFETARTRREWARPAAAGRMVSLHGRTALIVGMGAIGQAIARRARAFDMRVTAVSRAYPADEIVSAAFAREETRAAFAQADVIFICLPSDEQTRGFIDRDKLAAMKRTAFLINVSRGDVLVEEDLVEACRAGLIAGAGLDVADHEPLPEDSPLWRLDNVVLTPHVGGTGDDETDLLVDMIAENLRRWIAGRPLARRLDI